MTDLGPNKIVVVGIGYVGLSNAVLLAQHNDVTAVDLSFERVDMVNARKCPIIDADLDEFLSKRALNLDATTDLKAALVGADIVLIATPTDYDPNTNYFDISSVEKVAVTVSQQAPDATIVIKSTIPVGCVDNLRKLTGNPNIIFSPEFLREGRALYDNLNPSRIIVGDMSERAQEFAQLLVQSAEKTDIPVLFTGPPEAEAIKLFANTYLAMRVAFFLMNWTAIPSHAGWTRNKLLMGLAWIQESEATTITLHLAMADTVCQRIPSSFLPTTRRCHKTLSRPLSTPTEREKISWQNKFYQEAQK